jgi:hypothetical protein
MRNTLRNSFLVTTAAAALVTGITIASAQGHGGGKGAGGGGGAEHKMSQGPSGGGHGHSMGGAGAPSGRGMQHQGPSGGGHAQGLQGHSGGGHAQNLGAQGRTVQREQLGGTRHQRPSKAYSEERSIQGKGLKTGATTKGRTGTQIGHAQAGAQGHVSLNSQQRSRIHNVVVNRNFSSRFRASNVNFDVDVGTRIPRSFHLFVLPEDIVTIVPWFRGYRFFYYEDEIVIVDPVTFEIVAIIPV